MKFLYKKKGTFPLEEGPLRKLEVLCDIETFSFLNKFNSQNSCNKWGEIFENWETKWNTFFLLIAEINLWIKNKLSHDIKLAKYDEDNIYFIKYSKLVCILIMGILMLDRIPYVNAIPYFIAFLGLPYWTVSSFFFFKS